MKAIISLVLAVLGIVAVWFVGAKAGISFMASEVSSVSQQAGAVVNGIPQGHSAGIIFLLFVCGLIMLVLIFKAFK